jgi:ferrochelatase
VKRVAVVLFNLGGPDSPAAVQPFLFNLFNDPAIIDAPWLIRWFLARMISRRRAPIAREIYAELGGASPLLPNTQAQAAALETSLNSVFSEQTTRVFIAMRYWHPFAAETAAEVADFAPDQVILLPLYPQYSTTTSQSSMDDWAKAARAAGVRAETRAICCYPAQMGFVEAIAAEIKRAFGGLPDQGQGARLLFSAHGLPKKIIAKGDPYQWQVERSAQAVVDRLGIEDLDWAVCYQSRVGPLEWIGPSTEDEIARAGTDRVPIVIAPIAFVSEHSETLVELDVEYRKLAETAGAPDFSRVPTVSTRPEFIAGLTALVAEAQARDDAPANEDKKFIGPDGGARLCPVESGRCPCLA